MATLAPTGRISNDIVAAEIRRLELAWHAGASTSPLTAILGSRVELIDSFEHHQWAHVIKVCQSSRSLSEAGRRLFNVSPLSKKQPNDADRLRKYLAKHDLTFAALGRSV